MWLAVIVVLVLWGLITHGTYAGTGDEPHYEMMTHSLAFEHDLDLTDDYNNPNNLALYGRFEAGAHVQPGRDGRLRPVHDIGMPLLFAPYYAVAYLLTQQLIAHVPARWLDRARLNFNVLLRHFLSLAMIGLAAAMAVRLLEIFSALSVTSGREFAWALLMVLSPPIMSHSFLFFTEIVSAFIALSVFIWLRRWPEKGVVPLFRRDLVEGLLAGAALGFLFLVHARNVGLIAGLLAVALVRARRSSDRRLLVAFLGGAAVLFAVRTAVNYHFWGTWITTPQARVGEVAGWESFVVESVTRISGWLFDQEHGLLPYAPIYLLAPAGWLALWKRDRGLCAELSIVIAAYVVVMTIPQLNAHGWRGGWSPAGRFLLPVAPFLAVLAFAAVAHIQRLPIIVLALVIVQVCFDAVIWHDPHLLWNDGIGTSALLKFLDYDSGWLSSFVPSVMTPFSARTIALVAAALGGWVGFTAWMSGSRSGAG